MMQGLMGNYLEQSKDLFVKMQEQMQNSPAIFKGFPFPGQPNKTEKE
jgi:polyhydroxyalkanoate synthesis regulator protein